MKRIEEITIELAGDGMIVRDCDSADVKTECYSIREASLYMDDTHGYRPVPVWHLWLIWFGSLPILAAIVYALMKFL